MAIPQKLTNPQLLLLLGPLVPLKEMWTEHAQTVTEIIPVVPKKLKKVGLQTPKSS